MDKNNALKSGGLIIGGPSRSGKTTLTKLLKQSAETPYCSLPVEGLLDVFYRRPYIRVKSNKEQILRDYLFQTRYLDEGRSKEAAPIDFFSTDFKDILKNAPDISAHHMELILYALDVFADDNDKDGWAVCDLHAEFYFHLYKKLKPDLKLFLMYRNPLENVCASMYWRHFPERNPQEREILEYAVMMWISSLCTAMKLKELFPEDVLGLSLNDLTEGEKGRHILGDFLKVEDEIIDEIFDKETPWFLYGKNKDFYTPDGKWQELLNDDEISFIKTWTDPVLEELEKNLDLNNVKFPELKSPFALKLYRMLDCLKQDPLKARAYCLRTMDFSKKTYFAKKRGHYKMFIKNVIRMMKF